MFKFAVCAALVAVVVGQYGDYGYGLDGGFKGGFKHGGGYKSVSYGGYGHGELE